MSIKTLKSFDGGLNLRDDPLLVADNETPFALNVYAGASGHLKPRQGYQPSIALEGWTGAPHQVTMMGIFEPTSRLIPTSMYVVDANGNFQFYDSTLLGNQYRGPMLVRMDPLGWGGTNINSNGYGLKFGTELGADSWYGEAGGGEGSWQVTYSRATINSGSYPLATWTAIYDQFQTNLTPTTQSTTRTAHEIVGAVFSMGSSLTPSWGHTTVAGVSDDFLYGWWGIQVYFPYPVVGDQFLEMEVRYDGSAKGTRMAMTKTSTASQWRALGNNSTTNSMASTAAGVRGSYTLPHEYTVQDITLTTPTITWVPR